MGRSWWVGLLLGLVAALPFSCASQTPGDGDDLERNRQLLEKWRADPDHYQRLWADLRAFHALPREQQERLRRLDRQLHEADQVRLWHVLERYACWVARLETADPARLLAARSTEERMQIVRELREREWRSHLPALVRTELDNLPPELVRRRVSELRREEALLRRQMAGLRTWQDGNRQPIRLVEFPVAVMDFVEEKLLPRLRPEQGEFLEAAEGREWPVLARSISVLATRYPVYPPPRQPRPTVLKATDLPARWKEILDHQGLPGEVRQEVRDQEGRWPQYPLAVVNLANRGDVRFRLVFGGGSGSNIFPWGLPALGASRPEEFPPEIEEFISRQLVGTASSQELVELKKREGAWPTYPRYLHELAGRHHLAIPGMSLPGPPELWERARKDMPEVPGLPLPRDDVER
jgi:hypothetical protein